jgi:hypothetical protein
MKIIPLLAAPLFLLSFGAYIYIQIYLRPKDNTDREQFYAEFEEYRPDYTRYLKWSKITLATASVSALLLFISVYLF